jgi:hypothetical protein
LKRPKGRQREGGREREREREREEEASKVPRVGDAQERVESRQRKVDDVDDDEEEDEHLHLGHLLGAHRHDDGVALALGGGGRGRLLLGLAGALGRSGGFRVDGAGVVVQNDLELGA